MDKTKKISKALLSKVTSSRAAEDESIGQQTPTDRSSHDIPRKPVPGTTTSAPRRSHDRHIPIEIPRSSHDHQDLSTKPLPPPPPQNTTTLPILPSQAPSAASTTEQPNYPPGDVQHLGSDTTVERKYAPAVVHETVIPHRHEIIQKHVTRDIHEHHVIVKEQSIFDTEILPAKHFTINEHGQKVEITGFDMGKDWDAAWKRSVAEALLKK